MHVSPSSAKHGAFYCWSRHGTDQNYAAVRFARRTRNALIRREIKVVVVSRGFRSCVIRIRHQYDSFDDFRCDVLFS